MSSAACNAKEWEQGVCCVLKERCVLSMQVQRDERPQKEKQENCLVQFDPTATHTHTVSSCGQTVEDKATWIARALGKQKIKTSLWLK